MTFVQQLTIDPNMAALVGSFGRVEHTFNELMHMSVMIMPLSPEAALDESSPPVLPEWQIRYPCLAKVREALEEVTGKKLALTDSYLMTRRVMLRDVCDPPLSTWMVAELERILLGQESVGVIDPAWEFRRAVEVLHERLRHHWRRRALMKLNMNSSPLKYSTP